MRFRHSSHAGRTQQAFTLTEIMIAVVIMTMIVVTCFAAITFNRVAHMKAKEEAIALDFLMHYVETVKALPFDDLRPGVAISPLFDGGGGAPNIRIPLNATWVSVSSADYQVFHPDLIWLTGRRPELQAILTPEVVGGLERSKHLHVTFRSDPPLGLGSRLNVALDTVRAQSL
jgi:prepilin-type N-terminal cleavage/methylation domain-containing protein